MYADNQLVAFLEVNIKMDFDENPVYVAKIMA